MSELVFHLNAYAVQRGAALADRLRELRAPGASIITERER
jgi:hypothetical protein